MTALHGKTIIITGALSLLRDFDPRYAALDVIAAHLCMVNLKNAYWRRSSGPEAAEASWRIWWTSGAQGRASWRRVIARLRELDYRGPI